MANRNKASKQIFSGHYEPTLIDCNFIVDSTNGNGLGIRSLKGAYVQNVFMHTSSTPGKGQPSITNPSLAPTNPNPASGTIVIQFQDGWSGVYSGSHSIVSPVSGTPIVPTGSNLTIGVGYVITALGAMTKADWVVLGVPVGIIPAVGVAFIAAATGATSGGSSAVEISAATGSGVATIETLGNSNLGIAPNPLLGQTFGGQIIVQCRDYTGALVAPAAGSVIALSFLLSNSSQTLQGN